MCVFGAKTRQEMKKILRTLNTHTEHPIDLITQGIRPNDSAENLTHFCLIIDCVQRRTTTGNIYRAAEPSPVPNLHMLIPENQAMLDTR